MEAHLLPTINAGLNSLATVLLVLGWALIRRERRRAHGFVMAGALAVSTLFLICYLIYHYQVGSVKFQGTGWIRPVYFFILVSHIILAIVIVPLVLRTVYLACKRNWSKHCAWAKWTLPLWLYVSVTGVLVYWMLYRL